MIVRWRTDANGVQKAEYQGMTLVLEEVKPEPGKPSIAVIVDGVRTRQRFHTPKAAMEATDAALRRQVTLLGAEVQARQRGLSPVGLSPVGLSPVGLSHMGLSPQKAAREAMKLKVKFTRKAVQSA